MKYGALSVEAGRVTLQWQDGEEFRIHWKETGGPLITNKPETNGFGNVMVQASVRSLGGRIEHDWIMEGSSVTVHADPTRVVL